ncbi:MAG TPA: aminopeptidase P family protein [Paracoccaceae bacterium]|nr:aminopeptidase P family protein [Paracoccaceae bacterium]
MFQSFESTSSPEQGPARLAALRAEIASEGLVGFIVPRADAHQGEYVAPCDARLAWLSGFTGSAGFCAVLPEIAGVFVDGRYRLQVRSQVALEAFTPVDWPEVGLADWLIEQLPKGGEVGFDPWLHSVDEITKLRAKLTPKRITLTPIANLVDRIWDDRPAPPSAPFEAYPVDYAGEAHEAKLARLGKALTDGGYAAAAITLTDSVAWLLNIRGHDIQCNPVPHAFAILNADGTCNLFCRAGKADAVTAHLGGKVRLQDEEDFATVLASGEGKVLLDARSGPQALADAMDAADRPWEAGADPCVLPKACKNETEIAGMREAHLRDGAAVSRFLAWMAAEAPKGGLTEIDVATALEGFRRDTNALLDISFESIVGAGPNGAIMHYRVTHETNRSVNAGELVVVDSGGQYLDGTTDITRTVGVGPVGEDEKRCYTRVLQGMIAISRARFPKGVAGAHLDALARYPLWAEGKDFDHGTGHGVGAYLCVHEGPQRISRVSDIPLEPGMILSNEPGYYRNGAFGIRIENLIVVKAGEAIEGGDPQRKLLSFETITFAPLDRALIVTSLLSQDERAWIDDYHAQTLAKIGPRLDGAALDWLKGACAPL